MIKQVRWLELKLTGLLRKLVEDDFLACGLLFITWKLPRVLTSQEQLLGRLVGPDRQARQGKQAPLLPAL